MKPAGMMSHLQKAWDNNKLVIQCCVCINAGESFATDNQQWQYPTFYLRSADVQFVGVCVLWRFKES